jgi:hypothetical protein
VMFGIVVGYRQSSEQTIAERFILASIPLVGILSGCT